ncbi:MAG TPA: hypothetical protein VJU52_14120, partial [Flavobacterium sp.]|nr:hypothetical protein [Flavobacterium sp.]
LLCGQTIFENPIVGVNLNESNPCTIGQLVDSNITVTGIGRGSGIFGINSNNRYDARSWKSDVLDPNAYFEFTIIPNTDKKLDFVSFVYTGQISINGPTLFAFRSSIDDYASDIGIASATGSTISLSANSFQNVASPITFRLYGWAATTGTGTFSINDFKFNGIVSCAAPQIPILPEISLSCSATSFVLNWPASLHASNYFIDIATDSGFVNNLASYQNKALGNTLSETVTDLIAGETYYVRLHSTNDCVTSGYSNTIKVAAPETIYDGTWSNGFPDLDKNVRFLDDFNVNGSFEACSCQIEDGASVHVDSGGVLKLQNGLYVGDSSTLTFENNASLIQVNDDAVNSAKIIYKRDTNPMKNFDYTHWTSPVKDQILNVLSPNTQSDKYFYYANSKWVAVAGTEPMSPAGKGFIIRVPKSNIHYSNTEYWTGSTYIQKVAFEGEPNNGVKKIVTQGVSKYNLIGNPYPSAIDADSFINGNLGMVGGALYFWTHNTAITNNAYTSNDYAVYNLTGGTGVAAQTGGPEPNGKIASGVAFFVRSTNPGFFEFNNSMRISEPSDNSQFFRQSKTKKTAGIEKNRVWLNLTNSGEVFKQLLVGYIEGASNDFDKLYDGIAFNSNNYIDFYSVNNGKNLGIQGRAVPFDKTDKVPLGYKTTIEGVFEIKIDHADGLLAKCNIYLEDTDTGILHDLKKSSYSFSTLKGEYNERFVLRYLPSLKSISKQDLVENNKHQLEIYTQENQLSLKSRVGNISTVIIYDLKGNVLYQKEHIDKEQFVISDIVAKHQILIVQTFFSDTASRTDKVIF